MLDRIRAFFSGDETEAKGGHDADELQLAVAGLLVEAAHQDGEFADAERRTIEALLQDRLKLTAQEATELIGLAEAHVEDKTDFWSFAQVVKNRFDHDERVQMMEMLWEVAYADGVLHDYEASLMRRLAGLVYVSDSESGQARKRALDRLGRRPESGSSET